MTAFVNIFGGNTVVPAEVSYIALTMYASTTLVWPTESIEGANYVASQLDVTATTGGLTLIMPSALLGSTGPATLITNVGSNSFTVTDNTGVPIVTIAASVAYLITLTSNTTQAGTWRAMQFGATTSNAQASSLADNETTQANGSKLQVFVPTNDLSTDTNLTVGFRGSLNVWQIGSGPGTLQLDTIGNLGVGWFCYVTNESLNAVMITTTGGATINGGAALTLLPGNGTMIVCAASGFNSIYLPIPAPPAISQFMSMGIDVAGGSPATLTTDLAVPTGALIVVGIHDFSMSGESGVTLTDSVANTYTLIRSASPNGSSSNGFGKMYRCWNATALPMGGTITYTNTIADGDITVTAAFATGVLKSSDPLDTSNVATGTGTTASVSTGATVANELFVGYAVSLNKVFAQASAWSAPLDASPSGFDIGGNLRNINATSETFNPTLSTGPWAIIIASFKPGF